MIIIINCNFLSPALADGLPLKSEKKQVSSSFQDSSLYSGWPEHWWSLDCLSSSTDFVCPITEPLGIAASAPVTLGITVTFMFHDYF